MSAVTPHETQALARAVAGARRRGMEKKLDDIRLHVSEDLKVALMRLAADDDRALGDYCRRVLELHVYGHAAKSGPGCPGCEGTNRDE